MIGRLFALVGVFAHSLYPLWAVPGFSPAGRAALGILLAVAFTGIGAWLERRLPDPAPARLGLSMPLAIASAAAAALLIWPATWPLMASSDEQYHAYLALPAWEALGGLGVPRPLLGLVAIAAAVGLWRAASRPWPAWAWALLGATGAIVPLAGAGLEVFVSPRATEHIYRFPALAKPLYLLLYLLLGPSEFAARLPSIVAHLASAALLRRLLEIGGAGRVATPAAAVLLFAPTPLFFARLAFLDSAGLAFSLAALALYVEYIGRPSRWGLSAVALVGGVGFLYRPTALLAVLVVILSEAVRSSRARRVPEGGVEALAISAFLIVPFLTLHRAVVGRGHALALGNVLHPDRLLFQATQILWTAGLGVVLAPLGLRLLRSTAGRVLAVWGLANYAMMATAAQWAEPRLVLPFLAAAAAFTAAGALALPRPRLALSALLALEILALAVPLGRAGQYTLTEGRWFLRYPYREAIEGIARIAGQAPAIYHPAISVPRHFYASKAGLSLERWEWEPFAPPERQTVDGLYAFCRARGLRYLLLPTTFPGTPGEFEGFAQTLNPALVDDLLAGFDPRFRELDRWSYGPNELVLLEVL